MFISINQNRMRSKEENNFLDRIFQNLNLDAFENFPQQVYQQQLTQSSNTSQFSKECMKAKLKIFKILKSDRDKLKVDHFQMICKKLRVLGSSQEYLENEGLINVYIDFHDEKRKAKKNGSRETGQITYKLLRCFERLIRFFFFNQELKEYRKYKNMLHHSLSSQIQSLDQVMQAKIKERTLTKKCSELFKEYLKNQEANHKKQLCRVCYKKIEIPELAKHLHLCGKKTYLKQQLSENFQQRMKILQALDLALKNQTQKSKIERIKKVVEFYRKLKKEKSNRRMSIRFEEQNPSLFFYNMKNKSEGQRQLDLIAELHLLQDKVLCLSKKLKQVQIELYQKQSLAKNNFLKMSLNPTMKKYQSMMSKQASFSNFCNSSLKKENIEKKQEQEPDIFDEIKQEEGQNETFTKIKRIVKKKLSYDRRDSSDSKTDENGENYRQITFSHFQILKLLGKGAFGRVYLVRRKKTNDIYAMKAIRIDKSWGQNELKSIKNQYGIYKKIEGIHLVAATFSFHEKNAQFFILQFMPGGDLSKIIQENVYLEQQEAKFYLAEILLAIEHLHKAGIIHRDLKPENIVLDSKGHLKLTDFGLSQFRVLNKIEKALDNRNIEQKQKSLKSSNKKNIVKTDTGKKLIGTPDYIAPEIIEGISLTNPSIDWWSFGVIAYQMMIGCRPFCANSIEEILANIEKGQIQWPEIGSQEGMISAVAADFMKGLLQKNYEKRLGYNGAEEIKKHKFFQGVDWKNLKSIQPPLLNLTLNLSRQMLRDDMSLRKQIQILMQSETENPLQQLKNYVRYDLLTAQTLQSVKQGAIKKQKRIRKLQSVAQNFEEQDQPKYKQTSSDVDEDI